MLQREASTSNFSLVISETIRDDPMEALQNIKVKKSFSVPPAVLSTKVRP